MPQGEWGHSRRPEVALPQFPLEGLLDDLFQSRGQGTAEQLAENQDIAGRMDTFLASTHIISTLTPAPSSFTRLQSAAHSTRRTPPNWLATRLSAQIRTIRSRHDVDAAEPVDMRTVQLTPDAITTTLPAWPCPRTLQAACRSETLLLGYWTPVRPRCPGARARLLRRCGNCGGSCLASRRRRSSRWRRVLVAAAAGQLRHHARRRSGNRADPGRGGDRLGKRLGLLRARPGRERPVRLRLPRLGRHRPAPGRGLRRQDVRLPAARPIPRRSTAGSSRSCRSPGAATWCCAPPCALPSSSWSSVDLFVVVSVLTGIPFTLALMTWSFWYPLRAFQRQPELWQCPRSRPARHERRPGLVFRRSSSLIGRFNEESAPWCYAGPLPARGACRSTATDGHSVLAVAYGAPMMNWGRLPQRHGRQSRVTHGGYLALDDLLACGHARQPLGCAGPAFIRSGRAWWRRSL